jgi:hypothetical protein
LKPKLRQNWCCLEACLQIWYCWIIPCPPCGSNDWCDDAVRNHQLLGPHLCPAMPFLGPGWAKSFAHCNQNWGKTDAVWRHVTEYDAAESFHVLHMGPMSDDIKLLREDCNKCLIICQRCILTYGPEQDKFNASIEKLVCYWATSSSTLHLLAVVHIKNEYYVIELCLEHPAYLSTRAYFQANIPSQKILVSRWSSIRPMDGHTNGYIHYITSQWYILLPIWRIPETWLWHSSPPWWNPAFIINSSQTMI